jgi:hypothetical protein
MALELLQPATTLSFALHLQAPADNQMLCRTAAYPQELMLALQQLSQPRLGASCYDM